MSRPAQSFESHARIVPGYHRVTLPLIAALLVYSTIRTVTDFSPDRLVQLGLVVALALVAFYARAFAIGVQDRLIRLEERLRLERLLPPELQSRLPELSTSQLIGLRFASDEEAPALVRRAMDESLDRKAIKQAVRTWRPDHERI